MSVDRVAAQEMIQKTGQRGVPVITVDGEVVIGFDRARLEQLLARQTASPHPSFGLQVADASKIAQKFGAVPVFGAFVGGVRAGSGGERAGLQKGDVITEINLHRVSSADDLERALSSLSPGSRVAIVFLRGQKELRSEIVV